MSGVSDNLLIFNESGDFFLKTFFGNVSRSGFIKQ